VIRLRLDRLATGRRQVFEALRAEGIGVQVHYIPIHLQPLYRDRHGLKPGDFPAAEAFYAGAISIPLFPRMSDDDARDVVTALRKVLDRYAR
jgi:perosamine synthetase